LKTTTTI